MSTFVFEDYSFSGATGVAIFSYRFGDGRRFVETVNYTVAAVYDKVVLEKALFLAFVIIGTSYYKTFPTVEVVFETGSIDDWQAAFFNNVYQEGMSQFAFENNLTRADLAHFTPTGNSAPAVGYGGEGILALQSGGKDSLLTAMLLQRAGLTFTPWYVSSTSAHPLMLDELGPTMLVSRRTIDHEALQAAKEAGATNGHVPVTYIVQSLALIQAIVKGYNQIIVSIAHEGEEPHATIGDLPVTHQWSKMWAAEQAFAQYVQRYVSPDITIGSPLRAYSELRVAELFVEHAWGKFGQSFSSCNQANYRQRADNTRLVWCANCAKCANSYLLFAPFVDARELQSLFGGQDLFALKSLFDTFKGLLGVDGVMKPFECVGEIDELRRAYQWSQKRSGYGPLPFDVPESQFDYMIRYPSQDWPLLQ